MSHCVIEDVTDQIVAEDFDASLGDILIKHKGDTQSFLTTVLGFLKRKTDFYKHPDPKKRILDVYKEISGANVALKGGFLSSKPGMPPAAEAVSTKKEEASTSGASPLAPVAGLEGFPKPADAEASSLTESSQQIPEESEKEEDKGLKPTAARGAVYENYSWGQTLSEVTVSVGIPKGTRGKMLDVVISKNKLKVGLKGQTPIIDGELKEPVKPDDCMWNIIDDSLEITLSKADGMHWWTTVIKGDPEINAQKVEPENSKLTDLDADTRQTVEKMMFDQRQKAMGRPTSEEMQKQDMLKNFMSAHPEMDFSKAKMM